MTFCGTVATRNPLLLKIMGHHELECPVFYPDELQDYWSNVFWTADNRTEMSGINELSTSSLYQVSSMEVEG